MNQIKQFVTGYFSSRTVPYWCVLALDCAIVLVSGYIGAYFDRGGMILAQTFWATTWGLLISLLFYIAAFRIFRTYKGIIRFSSFSDLQRIAGAVFSASLVTWLVSLAVNALRGSATGAIIFPSFTVAGSMFAITTLLMFFVRVAVKRAFDTMRKDSSTRKAFIYGVREGGVALAKSIQNQVPQQFSLKGFISPDGDFKAEILMNVDVHKDGPDVVKEMQKEGAEVLIVSPLESAYFRGREDLVNNLMDANIKIMMMPVAEQWDGKSELLNSQMHEVVIEDLLPRDQFTVDDDAICAMIKDKRVLITGAAGIVGSELVRQIAPCRPAELILIDQNETTLRSIHFMMAHEYAYVPNETIVCSITDKVQMENIFATHKPDYVFHAAAYKHISMTENNPAQVVRNNINGTRIIADLSVKYGASKFLLISTDNAANPTSVVGCSKRFCEIYCQSLNQAIASGTCTIETAGGSKSATQLVITRFGNIVGNNSSIITVFSEQIKRGGPVFVSHPDAVRFFMLIPDACKLVLEAFAMGKGGEIFVFDMGKPVKISELARRMIKLSGASNIEIKFTGMRDGEKLYDEILSDQEESESTAHPKIRVVKASEYDYEAVCRNEGELLQISYSQDDMAIVKKMMEIVPECKSKVSKYQELDK